MKINTIIYNIIIVLSLYNCSSDTSNNQNNPESYQETKWSLKDKENQNPESFLSIKGTYFKNLLGEWVLEGTVTNSATIATFKDIVIEIKFFSKTNSYLGSRKETIFEFFPAKKRKKFKLKSFGYKGTKSISWSILRATPVN